MYDFYDLTAKYVYQTDAVTCNITAIQTHDSGLIDRFRELELAWNNTAAGIRCLGYDEEFNYPVDITVGYMRYNNREQTPGEVETYSSINKIYANLDHKETLFGHPLDYGVSTEFKQYETSLAEPYSDVESFNENRALVKGYLQFDFEPRKGLTIQPGLTSQATLDTRPTFEPRLRMAAVFGDNTRHELSVATGLYAQTFEGITDIRDAGTVFTVIRPYESGEPLPEAFHAIAGYYLDKGVMSFSVEGYIKRHKNIPVAKWTPLARVETETGLADGLTKGIDTNIEVEAGNFFGYAGYGYSSVIYEAASGDLGAWVDSNIFSYNPAHDQRHKLNLLGSYTIAGFTTNINWGFSTGRPYTGVFGFDLAIRPEDQDPMTDLGNARTLFSRPYGKRLPAQHRLDVSVEKSLEWGNATTLEMAVGAVNVYDRQNIFYYNLNVLRRVDQAPLMPYLSLSATIN